MIGYRLSMAEVHHTTRTSDRIRTSDTIRTSHATRKALMDGPTTSGSA